MIYNDQIVPILSSYFQKSEAGLLFTTQQLLKIYNNPGVSRISFHNKKDREDPYGSISNAILNNMDIQFAGKWKIHISINPNQMTSAIPILRQHCCTPSAPPMTVLIVTKQQLEQDHLSGKEITLSFDDETENSADGQKKIIFFLKRLAEAFEKKGIVPESKPPLTVKTEKQILSEGSQRDKENLMIGKYNAPIRYRANETLSYFCYHDTRAIIIEDGYYDDINSWISTIPEQDNNPLIKRSYIAQCDTKYKHNLSKHENDFLYGLILNQVQCQTPIKSTISQTTLSSLNRPIQMTPLDQFYTERCGACPPPNYISRDNPYNNRNNLTPILTQPPTPAPLKKYQTPVIRAKNKIDFLIELEGQLKKQILTRSDILYLFSEIKKKNGTYQFIHQQRNPLLDKFRLFFKSNVRNQDEPNFWHTATYQKAVKMLKEAYVKLKTDTSDRQREVEANAFIDYVRGNAPIHRDYTSTRMELT